jgi:hypothetical protein
MQVMQNLQKWMLARDVFDSEGSDQLITSDGI